MKRSKHWLISHSQAPSSPTASATSRSLCRTVCDSNCKHAEAMDLLTEDRTADEYKNDPRNPNKGAATKH